jgi:hypothetical protein
VKNPFAVKLIVTSYCCVCTHQFNAYSWAGQDHEKLECPNCKEKDSRPLEVRTEDGTWLSNGEDRDEFDCV